MFLNLPSYLFSSSLIHVCMVEHLGQWFQILTKVKYDKTNFACDFHMLWNNQSISIVNGVSKKIVKLEEKKE